jgi:hypothetical protein
MHSSAELVVARSVRVGYTARESGLMEAFMSKAATNEQTERERLHEKFAHLGLRNTGRTAGTISAWNPNSGAGKKSIQS